jgi:hypothetical protein
MKRKQIKSYPGISLCCFRSFFTPLRLSGLACQRCWEISGRHFAGSHIFDHRDSCWIDSINDVMLLLVIGNYLFDKKQQPACLYYTSLNIILLLPE